MLEAKIAELESQLEALKKAEADAKEGKDASAKDEAKIAELQALPTSKMR